MPGKGVTVSIIPHSGKPPKQFELVGKQLFFLRAGLFFAILLITAAVVIVAAGGGPFIGSGSRDARLEALEDSLERIGGIEARLDSIEAILEEIRIVRGRIENLSELAGPPGSGDP